MFVGHCTDKHPQSLPGSTVTVKLQLAVLLHPSSACTVTVLCPTGKQ
jgi:hypothetical protein